ncbi:MAG: DUF4349 domain-containing protein [Acidobacteriota bacterium]|nr:DUF4349 domain-containing protein [Acidobacteriota bacterium]
MKKIGFIAVLVIAVTTACSSLEFSASNTNAAPAAFEGKMSGGSSNAPATATQVSLEQSRQTQSAPAAVERKIIRNADLTLETDAPEEAQRKIAAIAEGKGGFVVESNQSSSDAKALVRDTVTMTVRVPAEKFGETLDEIRKTGSRTVVETVKGEDVTEEFIDVEARLKTQKALEEQFLEIMKRANSVADALNVQREIATVRGEIEKIEGRKKFLENQASLSTIKIRLQTPAAFSANSSGFFHQIGQSIGRGFDAALSFTLILISAAIALLPFLLFIVLPIYLLIRYFLRKSRRQKPVSQIAREEIKNE